MPRVRKAATHEARLSILGMRRGMAPVSGIAGVSSRGISDLAGMDPQWRPGKAERRMSESIEAQPTGPLRGLRVFDLTRVLAGPTCVQMLADLGADVIKIERPGNGDDTLGLVPPYRPGKKESAYFVGVNRNKRSVTLDMAQPEGQAIALQLVAQ